ncbi:MAG: carbamoyltransferase HypF [Planctomycetes bacterium]|nr:carbamoyltransferase HypF [Planctomycetota bacterium]
MIRHKLSCRGTVQGVGFRPAVHRLARELELAGSVFNGSQGAEIQVEGEEQAVAEFERRLPGALPGLARLEEVQVEPLAIQGEREFHVVLSQSGRREGALIPPDARLCDACRMDMENPLDRRFHYPFTTCTECGPRFSLVRHLPYDRASTSMEPFALCPDCAREYADLSDRRYHAEPVCCPACGPTLKLLTPDGAELARDGEGMQRVRTRLRAGELVAIKGLGGYQLACRADDESAVARLRELKRRPSQPLAVMAKDLDAVRRLVRLDPADERWLVSAEAPILLAPRLAGADLALGLAPGLTDVGVMLPTTPLHVELFRGEDPVPLVMTSGNARHEPIARSDVEALEHLSRFADCLLVHDREVVRRVDDSVMRSCNSGPFLVRRSRGFVPRALALPCPAPMPVLALGGYLQTTACLAVGREAIPSQHVGDLDTLEARAFLEEVALQLEEFLEQRAQALVVDEHPDYPSTWLGEHLAEQRGAQLLRMPHHLAHAAAVWAEQDALPLETGSESIALVLDGTGYGPDGTSWGCEWLGMNSALQWRRAACSEGLELVGGERAVREPWRVALAAMARHDALDCARELRPDWTERIAAFPKLLHAGQWPIAHGAGRLFEAAGALFGMCDTNSWEGEAAARLEALADGCPDAVEAWPEVDLQPGSLVLPSTRLLVAAARRLLAGHDPAATALAFHRTFAVLAAELSARAFAAGPRQVALAGGCLVNRHLRRFLTAEHARRGFQCLLSKDVPTGDGGLSYGQAALATLALDRNATIHFQGDLPCA